MEFTSSTDFSLESFVITPHVGKSEEAKKLIAAVEYSESITSPFLMATAQLVDSAGLLNRLAIKGGEKVVFKVLTNMGEEDFTYEMVIWTLQNRFVEGKKQTYTLGLISAEAITNEIAQVTVGTTGNPFSIIGNCIKTDLKSSKKLNGENSLFEVKMLPGLKRPFDFFGAMCTKSVSPQAKYQSSETENTNETKEEITGSGGFFFWETRNGFNFFAVDSLLADEKSDFKSKKLNRKAWGSDPDEAYTERPANVGDGGDDRFTIKRALFTSEVNLMDSLRRGKLSTKVAFFNHSTGGYSEYLYRLKDSYDNMAHLGGQAILSEISIGADSKELGDFPSRTMSVYIDHETWYNEPGVASPEPDDGSKDPTPYADWQKYYTVQSLSRYQLLQNQACTVVIPGNAKMVAGDLINIRLLNKMPDAEVENPDGSGPYDTESSGEYLIGEVTHSYDPTMGNNGMFFTTLRLMRDSYGMKNQISAHST